MLQAAAPCHCQAAWLFRCRLPDFRVVCTSCTCCSKKLQTEKLRNCNCPCPCSNHCQLYSPSPSLYSPSPSLAFIASASSGFSMAVALLQLLQPFKLVLLHVLASLHALHLLTLQGLHPARAYILHVQANSCSLQSASALSSHPLQSCIPATASAQPLAHKKHHPYNNNTPHING